MCVIVSVLINLGLTFYTFHSVDLLSYSVMLLQPNTDLFMERKPSFRVLNNQTREAY